MQVRDWVQERFGGTGETLLDESAYSDKELRKDIIKLEQKLKTIENEMDQHRRKYKRLLQEGADAPELERRKYAQKAKFEKKKYAIKKKKYRANSVKYGTLLSIQGMREITDLNDGQDLALDDALEDADAQEIQSKIVERMASFGVEMDDLQQIQDALDVPILEDELEMDVSEEEQLMEQIEAQDLSAEEVDVDIEDDVDLGGDIDEFDEPELGI
jgi:hypothetical protein